MIQRSSLVAVFIFVAGAHAGAPDQPTVTRVAHQPQQYHEDRLKLQGETKTANQNEQYHRERLRLNGGTKTANQSHEYHQRLLQLLQTTGGKTADARLKQYLTTYLARVDAKGADDHGRRVVDFGGCLIQRLYWNENVSDAQAACAAAVPNVKVAQVERCLEANSKVTSRECVTSSVSGELSVMAGAGAPAKAAAAPETAAAS